MIGSPFPSARRTGNRVKRLAEPSASNVHPNGHASGFPCQIEVKPRECNPQLYDGRLRGSVAVRPTLLRDVVLTSTRVGDSHAFVVAKLEGVLLGRDTASGGGAIGGDVRYRGRYRRGNLAADGDRAATAILRKSLLRRDNA